MYQVQMMNGGKAWSVVSEKDAIVFSGTKQEVEDWLDVQENAHRSVASMRNGTRTKTTLLVLPR